MQSLAVSFVNQGRETSEQYLRHDTVARWHVSIGRIVSELTTPVSRKESDSLELPARRDDLIATFGKSFNGDFGWAASKIAGMTLL